MTVRSKYLSEYADDDFSMFVSDTYGNLLEQYELGKPSGDSFTLPSLYQNGFIVNPPKGQGGYIFQLAYADGGLPSMRRHPPKCTV